MFFRDVVGQEKAKSLLRKYAERQQIPHALLFTGEDYSASGCFCTVRKLPVAHS